MSLTITVILTAVVGLLWGFEFDWRFHRYMHRAHPAIAFLFAGHMDHHDIFGVGPEYRLRGNDHRRVRFGFKILRDGLFLYLLSVSPFLVAAVPLSRIEWYGEAVAVVVTGTAIFLVQFGTIEWIHWWDHAPAECLPKGKWFQFVSRHHWLHHKDPGSCNFNTALPPIADWWHGTLRT
jgi:hypothetical protein